MRNFPPPRFFAAALILLLVTGCSSAQRGNPVCTTIKIHQPKSPPIRTVQRLNPVWWLGNMDDPVPPDWYRPGKTDRQWQWQLRNPFHNFTFYVVGVSDRPATRTGRFPAEVFPCGGGWNWAVHRCKFILLPFVAFEGARWRFYLGWRDTGNLGAKLNFGSRAKWYPPQPATK